MVKHPKEEPEWGQQGSDGVEFGCGINQNAPVLDGLPKGPDWTISAPPAALQDGGGLDPECRNETTDRVW